MSVGYDMCLICGAPIPEGRQVCPMCGLDFSFKDMVAVVRCKDCKWFKDDDEEMAGYCEHLGIGTSMDEYCSDGRKK